VNASWRTHPVRRPTRFFTQAVDFERKTRLSNHRAIGIDVNSIAADSFSIDLVSHPIPRNLIRIKIDRKRIAVDSISVEAGADGIAELS